MGRRDRHFLVSLFVSILYLLLTVPIYLWAGRTLPCIPQSQETHFHERLLAPRRMEAPKRTVGIGGRG